MIHFQIVKDINSKANIIVLVADISSLMNIKTILNCIEITVEFFTWNVVPHIIRRGATQKVINVSL